MNVGELSCVYVLNMGTCPCLQAVIYHSAANGEQTSIHMCIWKCHVLLPFSHNCTYLTIGTRIPVRITRHYKGPRSNGEDYEQYSRLQCDAV
jgi:hypothetical protein